MKRRNGSIVRSNFSQLPCLPSKTRRLYSGRSTGSMKSLRYMIAFSHWIPPTRKQNGPLPLIVCDLVISKPVGRGARHVGGFRNLRCVGMVRSPCGSETRTLKERPSSSTLTRDLGTRFNSRVTYRCWRHAVPGSFWSFKMRCIRFYRRYRVYGNACQVPRERCLQSTFAVPLTVCRSRSELRSIPFHRRFACLREPSAYGFGSSAWAVVTSCGSASSGRVVLRI